MDSIVIRGMQFFGYHGVLSEENRIGQRFIVHLKLFLPLGVAGRTDDVQDTVNYATVYQRVKSLVEEKTFRLIERLADEIARVLLTEFTLLEGVGVEVEKPGAPIPGVFQTVSVVIERFQGEVENHGTGDGSKTMA